MFGEPGALATGVARKPPVADAPGSPMPLMWSSLRVLMNDLTEAAQRFAFLARLDALRQTHVVDKEGEHKLPAAGHVM
jgi:hypothetical protein